MAFGEVVSGYRIGLAVALPGIVVIGGSALS
jgi:hypothetical protein